MPHAPHDVSWRSATCPDGHVIFGAARILTHIPARESRSHRVHERIADLDGLAHCGLAQQRVGPLACVYRAIDLRRGAGDCRMLR